MNSAEERIELMYSIQRALSGQIPDKLCSVTCGIDAEKWIHIVAYFDGPASDDDRENISVIGTEVIADFPDGYRIKEQCLDINHYQPKCLDFWAFRREGEDKCHRTN